MPMCSRFLSTSFAGQTATFTVVATGGGLSYQWQSMPSGGSVFTNIPGATLASYTTGVLALTDNGTQFRCVVTNAQNSVTSSAATVTVLTTGINFVTSKTLGLQRNDFSGWVGMSVAVGPAPLTISSVGRIVGPNNTGTHTVKIVNANGPDVTGGSAQVNTVGGTTGSFVYGALAAPIVLNANTTYYVMSQEVQGGDVWYDNNTAAQTTSDASLAASVYFLNGVYTAVAGTAGPMYVPGDFKYAISVAVSVGPGTANLFGSQTQQFTATVTGNANTQVSWSINPTTAGTVSSTGLYTAPATIAAVQTVTVTATSVADTSKTATATVTLNPPAPPSITQQPANATSFAGQTATFTVVATGGGLSYQWQSMPSGGSVFTNIPGATLASYTAGVLALTDNGTQFRCVVTNAQNSVTSSAATVTVLTPGINFVTSKTLGLQRNDFSGWVGMSVAVGPAPLTISSVGRIVGPNNTETHTVKIVNANGTDVTGGSAQVNTVGGTTGSFVYGALAAPIVLNANTTYYVMSQEVQGGDVWYDNNTAAQTTSDASLAASVYFLNGVYTAVAGTAGHMYVPVDFKYAISVAGSGGPGTANLFGSQTQQFTATVTGNANTQVSWSINPTTAGTVSSTGLYTAPATIAAVQTVTVTATSVADTSKTATATVTLNPPAPPSITQQPANATSFAGQTATFTVVATGGGLSYQWQSMPSGGSVYEHS